MEKQAIKHHFKLGYKFRDDSSERMLKTRKRSTDIGNLNLIGGTKVSKLCWSSTL